MLPKVGTDSKTMDSPTDKPAPKKRSTTRIPRSPQMVERQAKNNATTNEKTPKHQPITDREVESEDEAEIREASEPKYKSERQSSAPSKRKENSNSKEKKTDSSTSKAKSNKQISSEKGTLILIREAIYDGNTRKVEKILLKDPYFARKIDSSAESRYSWRL